MPTLTLLRTCAALAASAALLTACGGGNDDDPTTSEQLGVLTVTGSNTAGINGVYGDGNLNLTDVDKKNPIGSDPEVCTFKYDGANKVGATGTAFGDVRYRPDAANVYQAYLTFNGKEYGALDWSNVAVVRDTNRIRLTGKIVEASDGDRITVNGIIPMRPNRPSGC